MTNDMKINLPDAPGTYNVYRNDPATNKRVCIGTIEITEVPSNRKPQPRLRLV